MNENNFKNEEKSEETSKVNTPKRKSIFSFILVFLLGALVAVAVCVLIYTYKVKELPKEDDNTPKVEENENNNDTKEENQTNKELDLSLDGEFVKGLYEKIPVAINTQVIYNGCKTTEAYLTGNQKMLFVLNKMRENQQYTEESIDIIADSLSPAITQCTKVIQKYKVEEVEANYKLVFGSNENIVKERIHDETRPYWYDYNTNDDCYYGYYYPGGGGVETIYRTTIDSVDASSDQKEIYVYDYYIMVQSNDRKWDIYNRPNSNAIGEELEDPTTYNKEERKTYLKDGIFEKYKNKLVKFKHTFVLDDNGNYYWYSCEPASQI